MPELTPAQRSIFEAAANARPEDDAFELRITFDPELGGLILLSLKPAAKALLASEPIPNVKVPDLGFSYQISPFSQVRERGTNQAVVVCCGSEAIKVYESPWITEVELIGKGPHIITALNDELKRITLSLRVDIDDLDQEIKTGETADGFKRHLSQPRFFRNMKSIVLGKAEVTNIETLRPQL